MLSVRDLTKSYHLRGGAELHAVAGVSFDVARGQSLAVVGESGSGKTTCARMIAGLESPTSGEIIIGGRPDATGKRLGTKERRARARVVQMVFQDPYQSLDRRQTVNGALQEVLDLHFDHTRAETRRRSAELLDLVGLSARHGESRPKLLSGGQRQRVAIARALVTNPALLILDEAVSALDVSIQAQVLNVLMDARASTGVALLFISHDLGVVRHISESVVVMHDGRVVEAGATTDVLDHPAQGYTRRLVESIPRPGWTPRRRQPAADRPLTPVLEGPAR